MRSRHWSVANSGRLQDAREETSRRKGLFSIQKPSGSNEGQWRQRNGWLPFTSICTRRTDSFWKVDAFCMFNCSALLNPPKRGRAVLSGFQQSDSFVSLAFLMLTEAVIVGPNLRKLCVEFMPFHDWRIISSAKIWLNSAHTGISKCWVHPKHHGQALVSSYVFCYLFLWFCMSNTGFYSASEWACMP